MTTDPTDPPAPAFTHGGVDVYHGACEEVLDGLPDASIDAVVTDPPYGLEFMGREWDAPWKKAEGGAVLREATDRGGWDDGYGGNPYNRSRIEYGRGGNASRAFQWWCEGWARQCLRVLKPGGYIVAFGGTRTYHRLACGIEDAGFEIRDSVATLVSHDDMVRDFVGSLTGPQRSAFWRVAEAGGFGGLLAWLYGQGFPKSRNAARAVDEHLGAEPEVVDREEGSYGYQRDGERWTNEREILGEAVTAEAREWLGWGTALKPAFEPIVLARKPMEGPLAANLLAHRTGAINVDGCRTDMSDEDREKYARGSEAWARRDAMWDKGRKMSDIYGVYGPGQASAAHDEGRWPANVAVDEEAAARLDGVRGDVGGGFGIRGAGGSVYRDGGRTQPGSGHAGRPIGYGDAGGPSRFYYCSKASTRERGKGNDHPTVKPLDLTRWLVRMVTPAGGTVLDLFGGSGTTGVACVIEGVRGVLVEKEPCGTCAGGCPDHMAIIRDRLSTPRQVSLLGQLGG